MKDGYKRRADYEDMPREIQLGILRSEVELAETDEEKVKAATDVALLEAVIERLKVRPASEQPAILYSSWSR